MVDTLWMDVNLAVQNVPLRQAWSGGNVEREREDR